MPQLIPFTIVSSEFCLNVVFPCPSVPAVATLACQCNLCIVDDGSGEEFGSVNVFSAVQ